MSRYDASFFEAVREGARRSAARLVPLVMELVEPRSVLDVGCGDGTWLAAFDGAGVRDYLGVDGVDPEGVPLAIPRERLIVRDLASTIALGRSFDLAISLEVGEHLPPDRADAFVASLTAHAPVVLFSAAVPFQTGVGHVNEQWPEYWAEKFAARRYRAADALRPRVWDDPSVTWWYAQNAILYVGEGAAAARPRLREAVAATDPARLTRIHPANYARIGELLEARARRRGRLTRRIGRFLRGRSDPRSGS